MAPLRAIRFANASDVRGSGFAGSYTIVEADDEPITFLFLCPCGCGALSQIKIGLGHKPHASPSWHWNGNTANPTLTPSVRQLVCGWHGYLRAGYWESV